jgi:hypothetical protein
MSLHHSTPVNFGYENMTLPLGQDVSFDYARRIEYKIIH